MKRDAESGFTLVELVFGAVIMALMVAGIGQLFIDNLHTVTLGKARAIGLALANEKVEALRDLPYDSLATQGGAIYPPGNIADTETVTRNNYKFIVSTSIIYVDDPYDGYSSCPCASGPAAGKPKDLYPYDYKKATINVTLASSGAVVSTLTTDIAGKAAETASNTGIISITVLDANGLPIPNATVTITNPNPTPAVNITTTTDANGLVVVPKLPPDSANRYQVTASLPGYSTDGTIPNPPGGQTAVKLNPNVLVQQITALTLSIDRVSTLYVHVADTDGAAIPNLAITITGAKKTMTNTDVFKYSKPSTTDASGNITLTGMEWDAYSFSLPSGYNLVTISPYSPVALDPNSSVTANLVVSTSGTYPTISGVAPISAQTGTTSTSVVITGSNLPSGTSLSLRKTGQASIAGTGCVSAGINPSMTLTCNISLVGAVTGVWDLSVTQGANTATQVGGFNVVP